MKQRAEGAGSRGRPAGLPRSSTACRNIAKLRYEEDFSFSTSDAEAPPNPAALLNNLICEGTRLGFHVIATCDTYNNVNRFLSRKGLQRIRDARPLPDERQ